MLQITIPATEFYDERENEFLYTKETILQLEHSLVSLSKWEAEHHQYFIDRKDLSMEDYLSYIRCMTITKNVDPNVYRAMPEAIVNKIRAYVDDPMTATILPKETGRNQGGRFITSELIYYWMSCYNLPFAECQKWHLNRLLTLINVCVNESSEKKKMPLNDIYAQNRMLNEQRKAKLKTRG